MLASARMDSICSLVTDGTHDSPKLQPSGVPFIKGKHISQGFVDFENCDYIAKEDHADACKRVRPQAGDVLFSNIGSVGDTARVSDNREFSIKNVALFRPDPTKVDARYFYYLVANPLFRESMLSRRSGSAQPFITLGSLRGYETSYHSVRRDQRRIASILSAYDDLIENNTRRIAILEEMARRIYEEWFVHFRFTGHENVRLVEGELGVVPEDWQVIRLGEALSTLEAGTRPKGGIDPDEKGIPSIGAENIRGLGSHDYEKEKFVSREFFDRMNRGRVRSGDVLLYKDGAHIGRKSMFRDGFPHEDCAVNEHVFILRPDNRISPAYLFFWLDQVSMTQRIRALNANAAQPGINQQGVNGLPLLLPPPAIVAEFAEAVEPALALLFNLAKKNLALRTTRDLLLPKLISGELDVSELLEPEAAVT